MVMFQGEVVNLNPTDNNFDPLIQSVKRFKVTYLFIFSNLSKYFKRFAAWLK